MESNPYKAPNAAPVRTDSENKVGRPTVFDGITLGMTLALLIGTVGLAGMCAIGAYYVANAIGRTFGP